MPHASRQLAIQLGLIVFCFVFVVFTRSGVPVSSQISTCVNPPRYPGIPPPKWSWLPNSVVTVKFDDTWDQSDRDAFARAFKNGMTHSTVPEFDLSTFQQNTLQITMGQFQITPSTGREDPRSA